MRVRCIDPNAIYIDDPEDGVVDHRLVLVDDDSIVAYGDVIDVDDELGARLCDQPAVWQAADGAPVVVTPQDAPVLATPQEGEDQ